MNKNVMYVIIAIVVVAILAVGAYFLFFNKPVIEIDMNAVSSSINTQGHFDEMAMMDLDKTTVSTVYGVEEGWIDSLTGKMPLMNVKASMYVMIKATEGNVDKVKTAIEAYGTKYEQQWEQYLPDQYELVKNRQIVVTGNYVTMIIAENAQDLIKLVK